MKKEPIFSSMISQDRRFAKGVLRKRDGYSQNPIWTLMQCVTRVIFFLPLVVATRALSDGLRNKYLRHSTTVSLHMRMSVIVAEAFCVTSMSRVSFQRASTTMPFLSSSSWKRHVV